MNNNEVKKLLKKPKAKNTIFSVSNSKLAKSNIASFNLPQGSTCPFAGECLKFCYAAKGNFRFKNVKNKYYLNLLKVNSGDFFAIANESIKALKNVDIFRIHASGDFFSKKYILQWFEIMQANPDKLFYAYTKSFILFKNLDLPANFKLIASEGTKNDQLYLNGAKTIARVFKDDISLNRAINSGNYIDASKNDLEAIRAVIEGKNVALRYH